MRAVTHSDDIDAIVERMGRVVGPPPFAYGHTGSECDDTGCSPDCRYADEDRPVCGLCGMRWAAPDMTACSGCA